MKTFWKVFLGVVISLVVVAALICAGIMISRHYGSYEFVAVDGLPDKLEGRILRRYMMDGLPGNYEGTILRRSMMDGGFGFGFHRPMMGRIGFASPFMMFGSMFLRWLLPLTLVGVVVYAVYKLGASRGKSSGNGGTEKLDAVVQGQPATEVEINCSNCGALLKPDWRNCPHCGTKR